MAHIGFTTTIPVEIILAAGHTPLDLNNIFITGDDPASCIREAERNGYPRTACAWIKGLYATIQRGGFDQVIMVTEGDCSQTHAMMETLHASGIPLVSFGYPRNRDPRRLREEIEALAGHFGVTVAEAEKMKKELRPIREKVRLVDEWTWTTSRITGAENHQVQVSCSDFNGDPQRFAVEVDGLLHRAAERELPAPQIRLGFAGVPPIYTDLYEFLESRSARVVFNEVQRQFTMTDSLDTDILEQYRRYTYPYDVFGRLADITAQIKRRSLDGIIHYVQAFCFRQIQDSVIRNNVSIPVLTLEGDAPGVLDERNRLRLEAFIETLQSHRLRKKKEENASNVVL